MGISALGRVVVRRHQPAHAFTTRAAAVERALGVREPDDADRAAGEPQAVGWIDVSAI